MTLIDSDDWTWLWIDGNLLIVWLSYTRLYQLLILLVSNCVRMFDEIETKIICNYN